jgi:uncharacterized membrane protein
MRWPSKTLVKTASYGLMHMVVAVGVAYALTWNLAVALTIGLVEPAVQTFAYFFHESAWHRWGGVPEKTGSADDPHNAVIDSTSPMACAAEGLVRRLLPWCGGGRS